MLEFCRQRMMNYIISPKSPEVEIVYARLLSNFGSCFFRKRMWALPACPGQYVLLPCFLWLFLSGLFILKL